MSVGVAFLPDFYDCVEHRTVFERLQPVIAIFSANPFLRYCVSLFAFFESMEKRVISNGRRISKAATYIRLINERWGCVCRVTIPRFGCGVFGMSNSV